MMEIKRIRPENYRMSVWSGGITEEIFIYPPQAIYQDRNFIYRISTAVVESEQSVFTPLPDYTRYIAPLSGALSLSVGPKQIRLEPFEVLEFDGGAAVSSQSRGGLRDLNLMVRKGHEGAMIIERGIPKLDSTPFQVILRLGTNGTGEYTGIRGAWIKPPGVAPENIKWESPIQDANDLYTVFTLSEASGLD